MLSPQSLVRRAWRVGLFCSLFLCVSATSWADEGEKNAVVDSPTPEAVARLYFDDLKAGRYEAMTKRMHPEALATFKRFMIPIAEAAAEDGSWDEFGSLFSEIESVDQLREATPAEFFEAFFTSVVKIVPQLRTVLADSEIEFVGHVMERESAHVVTRFRAELNDVKITKMSIISLKKTDDGWGVLLTGEIDGIAQSLKRRFL